MSRSPKKTGATNVMSGRCAPPAYGSLRTTTSPGENDRTARTAAATEYGIAPRCTGIDSACATIWPAASNSALEQSRRSLMFGLYAERMRLAFISSATAVNA